MKHLIMTAWVITALGVISTAIASLANLDALWILGGILLIITGVVKIVMVQIWIRIARLGTDEHDPINAL